MDYKIGSGSVAKIMASRWLSKWWWAAVVPLAALIIAGMHDWRFYIVALGVSLVAYPGVLAIVYYYHALSPEAVRAILPQTAKWEGDTLHISYHPIAEGCGAPAPIAIKKSEIERCDEHGAYAVLATPAGMLILPAELIAIDNPSRTHR